MSRNDTHHNTEKYLQSQSCLYLALKRLEQTLRHLEKERGGLDSNPVTMVTSVDYRDSEVRTGDDNSQSWRKVSMAGQPQITQG